MKLRLVATGLAMVALLQPVAVGGQDDAAAAAGAAGEPQALPGVELARTVATATGIAVTPLLGVSVVGAWKWYRAEEEAGADLPWYAATWFWVPGLTIALLLVFKDPLLGLVPVAKKPLDAIDVLENKASAVLAAPAVVPMFLSAFAATPLAQAAWTTTLRPAEAGLASLGVAGDAVHAALLGLAAMVFLAAFFCVWLAFHAINVLILLSPFGPLDFLLRSVKLLALAVLAGATLVHPYLGALVALLIVVAAIPIAAWSFRLTVFGGVLAADTLTFRHRREVPDVERLRAFAARGLGDARPRTYGYLALSGETLTFSYRPWLVFGRRTVELPRGSYRLGRGLLCPLLRLRDDDGVVAILRLPPRYRSHETELAELLALAGVDEMPLRRGLRAILEWLREAAGRGEELPALAGGRPPA